MKSQNSCSSSSKGNIEPHIIHNCWNHSLASLVIVGFQAHLLKPPLGKIHQTVETGEAPTHPNQKNPTHNASRHWCGAEMRMQIWRSHGNKSRINPQTLLKIGLAQVHWTENFRTWYLNQTRSDWSPWNQTELSLKPMSRNNFRSSWTHLHP